jgi:hypothetical protein
LDFTLHKYKLYLQALKSNGYPFLTFSKFMQAGAASKFCLIRHDVDRKPLNALLMAELEHDMGICSTYYFRTKRLTLKPDLIREIVHLGHEIGYHYENLSDTNGDLEKGLMDFEKNLALLNEITPIKTISMHGRPLKPHDNRDLWKIKTNHNLLATKYGILGEVYLDIDYTDLAYIGDTGRNWLSDKNNSRDKVNSNIKAEFQNGQELLNYFKGNPHPKLVFQIHPERWSRNYPDHIMQWGQDQFINQAKKVVKLIKIKK